MPYQVKQSSTAYPLVFFMCDSSDHVSGKTGLSPTVTLSKAGGSFASPSGSVTEIANGWYKVAGNATDSNTLGPLALHATGTGADPTDALYEVVALDVQDAVRAGLTALPNAAAEASGGLVTRGTSTGQLSVSGGRVNADVVYWNAAAVPTPNVTGVPRVDMTHSLGVAVLNFDGTLAAVTAGTDVTFPATDAAGDSVPDDARYEWTVLRLVGGTGKTQFLYLTTKTGTRKFGYVSAYTPVAPSTDTTYEVVGPWRANVVKAAGTDWASGAITASVFAADAITAAKVASDVGTEIADAVLSRSVATVESTMAEHTLGSVILATLEWAVSGTTWTVRRTDGSTTHLTKTLTTNAAAEPVTSVQ